MKIREVIISSERVNVYGSRVITSGISTEQYVKNPILLYSHNRERLPIGRMTNLRIEGNKLYGTPEFDLEDDFARQVAQKWDKGVLNMCSAGLNIIETSREKSLTLDGQTKPTITKSKLMEVSIVDIGGNDDALAVSLSLNGKFIELEDNAKVDFKGLELSSTQSEKNNSKNDNIMEQILLALGLPTGATAEQATKAISDLKAVAENLQLLAITQVVEEAEKAKKITADKKEHFIKLGKTAGIEALNETLNLISPIQKPTEVIKQKASQNPNEELKKLTELSPEQAQELKLKNPTEYKNLYKQEFGIECNI